MQSLAVILLCLLVGVCEAKTTSRKAKDKPPNLIIILTDDHGYHDVGFNGCEDIPTPHLDSIARNGIRFTEGYVSFPVCGPSRAGILTGRYQGRFGFTTNPTCDPANPTAGIPLDEQNIAELLKKVGYKSAAIGKWHMGTHPVHHPLNRGFDHFFGFLEGGHFYFPEDLTLNDLSEVKQKWEWYRTRLLNNHERVDIIGYLTDELTNAANAFIDSHAGSDSPFLLYLAYNAPHTPLQATEEYLSRFANITDEKRRTYAAMLSAVDDGVGRLLTNLHSHGIEEDTLVVFLSDNGGANDNGSNNAPLRGRKGDLWEGGMHVPFAMQWKGTLVPAGQDYTHPVISLDVVATITELAGATIAPERPLDGVNLIPYLTGEAKGPPHEQLFWRTWEKIAKMAVRQGNMKLMSDNQQTENYGLFDLRVDPGESQNLVAEDYNTTQALKQSWDEWNAQLMDCIFPTLEEDEWWLRSPMASPTNDNFNGFRLRALR